MHAREMYVVMKKDYRISRNIRASWFFQHLNKTLKFTPKKHIEDTNEELQVASVVFDNGTQCVLGNQYNVSLLTSTIVTFVARRYRFVIVLDLSPSVVSVDDGSCSVLYENIQSTFSNFLRGLILPFQLPGSCIILTPEIYITVLAYTPSSSLTFNQVLAQGLLVTRKNVDEILSTIAVKLADYENILSENFNKFLEQNTPNASSSCLDVHATPDPSQMYKDSDSMDNPGTGIVNMIRSGMLALQLLPENSCSGLVIVTDGCLGISDANLFEFLLTQLRTSTISCTFLRVGESRSPFGHFGHISHIELMQFIATATFGSYFDSCPDLRNCEPNIINTYHKAVFLWSFQRGLEGFRFDLGDQHLMAHQSSPTQLVQRQQNTVVTTVPNLGEKRLLSHPIHGKLASVMPNIRKRHLESNLNTSFFSVLSVRLREGYTIREIAITKGESQIDVRLVLPWREYARFEYLIRAAWPLDRSRQHTHTEITLEGSYDFLHDMTCTKINNSAMSSFRAANVKKFWLSLQGLSHTDHLLVHLQSFASNPVNYTLPSCIKEGVALFYLPLPISNTPTLSTQLNTKDLVLQQFATFWRPVVLQDIKVLQKWMHTHRISIVLEHDTPLHKSIHIPGSSSRYMMIMCRQAMTSLTMFLTEWATFVLLDNQSFIKLLFESDDKARAPCSFVLVCITSVSPCLALRLAFLCGTPAYQRYEIVKDLKHKIANLKFPQRGPKNDKHRKTALMKKSEEELVVRKPPLRKEWSEINCCVLFFKPVESILIRYDRMPRDMTKLEDRVTQEVTKFVSHQTQTKNKSAANLFNSLSRYLLHRRWIWSIQQSGVNSIKMQNIGRILSTLAKVRLQQGFHFSLTNEGIVNMVLEIDMKDPAINPDNSSKLKLKPNCVVQYILFPPYIQSTSDSLSDEDVEELESTEDDRELQIITECWVEPQYGISVNNTPERKQFDGLSCDQISYSLFSLDLQCISSLITMEHLMYLCQNNVIPYDLSSIVNTSCPGANLTKMSPTIEYVAFPFDLLSILPRSQQAELIFPTFVYNSNVENAQTVNRDANCLLFNLFTEELRLANHREVMLSKELSRRFFEQLYCRQRDTETNPFPFQIQSLLSGKRDASQDTEFRLSDTKTASKATTGMDDFPQLKCYIKSVNTNALLLTFAANSFDDLILLQTLKSSDVNCDVNPDVNFDINGISSPQNACSKTVDKQVHFQGVKSVLIQQSLPDEFDTGVSDSKPSCNNITTNTCETRSSSSTETHSCSQDQNRTEYIQATKCVGNVYQRPAKSTLLFPVYIYDCVAKNVLESLIDPWNFQLPLDIFNDMTFDQVCESNEAARPSSPKTMKRVSFSANSIKEEDDVSIRSIWRSYERKSTDGSLDGSENIWQHCSSVSGIYYNCFVQGVFQSLQKGYMIECQDVDAAINNICEESLPLETNMTTFLHASCKHFQHLVKEAKREQEREAVKSAVMDDTRKMSVRFMDMVDDRDGESPSPNIPVVLSIPKVTWTFDIATIQSDHLCESVKDLHKLVKFQFLDIVQKWFRPVPFSPDYYFFCPETALCDDYSNEVTVSETAQGSSANVGNLPSVESAVNYTFSQNEKDERISTTSVVDSEESLEDDVMLDFDVTRDDNSVTHDDNSDQSPLFINFTCTVKSRLQQYNLSMKNIAVCLGELSSILVNMYNVDLGDLKITFDLNCLTLPRDLDIASPKKASMLRMLSSNSGGLSTSSSGSDIGEITDNRSSSITHMDLKHLKDPISHLPLKQHHAVTRCMEEIEWMLKDEIISSLQHISPIYCDALNYAVHHIHTAARIGKSNVIVDSVPLQFVFGPGQSADKFIEEFQKMNLQNYQLIKCSEWYYIAKKCIIGYTDNFVNPSLLSNALGDLSQWNGKLPYNIVYPRDKANSSGALSELSGSDSKGVKVQTPLIQSSKGKVSDTNAENSENSDQSSPQTVRSEIQSSSPFIVHSLSPITVVSDRQGLDYKRNDKETSFGLENKSSVEVVNLEAISLINRHKSNELVLAIGKNQTKEGFQCNESELVSGKVEVLRQIINENQDIIDKTNLDINKMVNQDIIDKANETDLKAKELSSDPKHCQLPSCSSFVYSDSALPSTSGSKSHQTTVISSILANLPISKMKSDIHSADGHSADRHAADGPGELNNFTPDHMECKPLIVDSSYDNANDYEGILKRCSSFAGFLTRESRTDLKLLPVISSEVLPLKDQVQTASPSPMGRYRHSSAPVSSEGTPRSRVSTLPYTPSCISSRGSFTEDAYDGDMSEVDEYASTMISESDLNVHRLMPDFWLIMNIGPSSVEILFHHRETGKETNEETQKLTALQAQVKSHVQSTCRRVNQQLLLNDLYEKRICHNLLVDAADEDVSWKLDNPPVRTNNVSSSENDDEDDAFEKKYLAAALHLDPGHFDCKCVWRTYFDIHPGLKRGAGRGTTMSVGIKSLRSVLNRLSVNNRNNMFVIKETATGNVFYLKLKEIHSRSSVMSEVDGESSTSEIKSQEIYKDSDAMSVSSSTAGLSSSNRSEQQESVELCVHGIDEVGKEIKEDLVQMLQKKLNEATLEKICEMLWRNPQCQLDKHDVHFIQKPGSDPTHSLCLTVSNKSSSHLTAVMFYLRQNLLQFLHPPKYKSVHLDCQFTDTFDGQRIPIPTDHAFLYIPPHTVRKTGISIISVCLVDGQGNQVKLLQCPRPLSTAYLDIETIQDLESFVTTQVFDLKPGNRKLGPTALIQFNIWEVGDVDIPVLVDKLTMTLKYAICDVVMEYYILTAPICMIPKYLMEMLPPQPTKSAPCSPFGCMPAEDFRERKFSMVHEVPKKQAEIRRSLDRRSSLQNNSRLQSLKDALTLSSKKNATKVSVEAQKIIDDAEPGAKVGSPLPDSFNHGSPLKGEPSDILRQYESGDQGTLHPMYSDILEDWFQYCSQLEVPAVNKFSLNLKSRISMDYILQEIPTIVRHISVGMTTKVYKVLSKGVNGENSVCVLYFPSRHAFEASRCVETFQFMCKLPVLTPGVDHNFVAVGRDYSKWLAFMSQDSEDDDSYQKLASLMRGKQISQKFAAYIPTNGDGKTFGMFTETASLIPRQKFFMLTLKNKHLIVYTYNWTNDMFSSLSKQMTKLVQWSNARTHLLANIVTQKASLFNHYLYADMPFNLEKISQTESLDQLINNPTPPQANKEKLTRTSSLLSVRENYLPFDVTFRHFYPSKPLHLSYLACQEDPVKQYGQQVQDIRSENKRQYDKNTSIQKLYMMWLQKSAPNYPIAESIMGTLKQSSRLFHYCATPLLFSSKWRHRVLEKFKVTRHDSSSSSVSSSITPDTKSRSRHSSGTSTGSARIKRTDSNELKKRPSLPTFKEIQTASIDETGIEEDWHLELRLKFMQEYITYLQSVGFHCVQLDNSLDKVKVKKRTIGQAESKVQEEINSKAAELHYLQKTVSGGILLLEISFRQEYICVKVYTFDYNCMTGVTVNPQKGEDGEEISDDEDLKILFVDECEKCKELLHVHSFAHDFHLRCIQLYVKGQLDIFKPNYYLSGLLHDFIRVYPYAPSFSRNFLQREVVTIPEPTCCSQELYDYMLKHAKLHAMSVIKMVFPLNVDVDWDHTTNKVCEYALISHEVREVNTGAVDHSAEKLESYNFGLVILQDHNNVEQTLLHGEKPVLKLQFYIIMTSSNSIFPRQPLDKEKNITRWKSKFAGDKMIALDFKDQIAVTRVASVREKKSSNLGNCNQYLPPMYEFLKQEAVIIRTKIKNMALVSMDKCRRDTLWNKLLLYKPEEQSGKKKIDPDDPVGRLTFDEFKEMLERVHKVPLYEVDPRLVPFLHMSHSWYQGLAHVINNKYQENVRRCFINPENSSEQHYIVLNPKFLDLFMMLSIHSSGNNTGLYAVFRKPAKEQESICSGGQDIPEQCVQSHMEDFINICCFHLWNSML